jgi:hypothetical protein
LEVTFGAVYNPFELIVPNVVVHVTAVFDDPVTTAVNCTVFEDATVAVAGVTETLTDPAFETTI